MPAENTPSILVADDEPLLCETMRNVLLTRGYSVTCVDSGKAAVEKLKAGRFDVVLTDIFLPDVDGLQIISETRQRQPHAKIIAVSGGGAYMGCSEALKVARQLGACTSLEKPFNVDELLRVVDGALASKQG